jgi:hypothetical protein
MYFLYLVSRLYYIYLFPASYFPFPIFQSIFPASHSLFLLFYSPFPLPSPNSRLSTPIPYFPCSIFLFPISKLPTSIPQSLFPISPVPFFYFQTLYSLLPISHLSTPNFFSPIPISYSSTPNSLTNLHLIILIKLIVRRGNHFIAFGQTI